MRAVLKAIVEEDAGTARRLLRADRGLARWSFPASKLFRSGIFHWVYAGDTLLHLAAAGHRAEIVRLATF
jgi:hypothetical protein